LLVRLLRFTDPRAHPHEAKNAIAFFEVAKRVKIALARQIDFDDLPNRRWTVTHHEYAIRELDRFFDVVRGRRELFSFQIASQRT
jgi:hypothetical protein